MCNLILPSLLDGGIFKALIALTVSPFWKISQIIQILNITESKGKSSPWKVRKSSKSATSIGTSETTEALQSINLSWRTNNIYIQSF
jgi:hypothetical protein